LRVRIVKIGNSQGVRIPKALLEESGLHGDVDMSVHDGTLVIAPTGRSRQGWAEAFRRMTLRGDDEPVDGDLATSGSFETGSWEWE